MGNTKQGLQLLIDKMEDVKVAIEFVEEQHDAELWEDLIDMSMKNPKFVSGLLEHIGAYVDPIRLVKRIPSGMQIVGLRDRLVKIISDYNLQMSLREGCKEILKADCVDLAKRLNRGQKRAIQIEESRCAVCAAQIISPRPSQGVVIFFCSHVYHQSCLLRNQAPTTLHLAEIDRLWCSICSHQETKKKAAAATTTRTTSNRNLRLGSSNTSVGS
jgi:hypothetical protein